MTSNPAGLKSDASQAAQFRSLRRLTSDPGQWKSLLVLTLASLGMLLPFLDKPFHIDDPLFVWGAQRLTRNIREAGSGEAKSPPVSSWRTLVDCYGFAVLWNETVEPMHRVTQNPPLMIYFLAAASLLTGWEERGLHAACLIPALGVVIGTWRLGQLLCLRPLMCALAVLCTPIFLVSGTNVMCDTLMTCFWVWSILLWHEGIDRPSQPRLATAAMLAGLAMLTKYFAVSLIPLLVVSTIIRKRRVAAALLWLLVPVAMLGAWELTAYRLYRHGMISTAAEYARENYFDVSQSSVTKWFGTLTFTGACAPVLLFFAPRLLASANRHRKLMVALGLIVLVAVVAVLLMWWSPTFLQPGRKRAVTWDLVIQAAILLLLGIGAIAVAVADVLSVYRETSRISDPAVRDSARADAILLFSWVVGTFVFTGHLNWTVNGRSVLPMVPALSLLLGRGLDRNSVAVHVDRSAWWPLIPAAALTLVVTYADYRFAWTQREAAETFTAMSQNGQPHVWFSGHWGFQYYMELDGADCVRYPNPPLEAGDLFVLPHNNDVKIVSPRESNLVNVFRFKLSSWATTHHPGRCAGFYSDGWGVLPYTIGPELQFDPAFAAAVHDNDYDIYRLGQITRRVQNWPPPPTRRRTRIQRMPVSTDHGAS